MEAVSHLEYFKLILVLSNWPVNVGKNAIIYYFEVNVLFRSKDIFIYLKIISCFLTY